MEHGPNPNTARLVTIATYDQIYLADLARARLLDHGIPCHIQDQNMVGMNLFYSNAIGGIKLQVPDPFAKQAFEFIHGVQERDENNKNLPNLTCPACGSMEVIPRRYKRWLLILSSLLMLISTSSNTLFSTSESRYQCTTCRHEWDMANED